MKIAVDLHGTITRYPEKFMWMMSSWITAGDEVFVLSGPPKDEVLAELESLGFIRGIHFNHVVSIVDYLMNGKKVRMWQDEKNSWWSEPEHWWSAKADLCEEFGADVLIDDTAKYAEKLDTNRTMFWLVI